MTEYDKLLRTIEKTRSGSNDDNVRACMEILSKLMRGEDVYSKVRGIQRRANDKVQ